MPPRNPQPPRKSPRKPLPEELARDVIAHEDAAPGGKVRMTFRALLARRARLGVGLVVLTVLAGCSTATPDQELRRVGPASRVTSVTIQTVHRKVLVPVVLNGNQTATFLLDTGANITVIMPTLANRLGAERPPGGPKTKARVTSGQDVEMSLIRVKSIGVGAARIDNFPVAVYDLPPLVPGAAPPVLVEGLLGNDFVGLFTMTVDPRAGKLTLQLDDGPVR